MANGATNLHFSSDITAVDLETAISLLETDKASEEIVADLGDGHLARADGRLGLQGLLQRLRGHRLLLNMADTGNQESVQPLRSGTPDMHPQVAAILDALNN